MYRHWLRLLPVFLLAVAACSSVADDAEADLETLSGCVPTSCGDWTPFYGPDKAAVSCILGNAASGTASHVTINNVADGGFECRGETRVFVLGDGSAYLWTARDTECDDEALFDEYELQKCQVSQDAVAACQQEVDEWNGDPSTPNCTTPSQWLTACETVDEASCG